MPIKFTSQTTAFPNDWTVDDLLRKHKSRPYNPLVANTFFRAGFIETWGRGIEKITEACEADGVPVPECTVHSEDIMLAFKTKVTDRVIDKVTEKEADILAIIRVKPEITLIEMAEKIGVSRKTVAAKIKSLKAKNIIIRIGSAKKGYWHINE